VSQSMTIAPALEVAAADSASALNHFESLLRFETDCWDVHASLAHANPGFVLLDVRSPGAFAKGHVPGAINLPHRRITELICDTCSMHYAFGRLVSPPRKCERCENKAFEIY